MVYQLNEHDKLKFIKEKNKMKNSGNCPKCKSNNISEIKSDSLGARISTGALSIASVSYYVCCQCGYVEEWITEKKDLEKISDKCNR